MIYFAHYAVDLMAAMLEVQQNGMCYEFHCRIQPAWVAEIVRRIPKDRLQTNNKRECLVVLPTGFGKSLVYQLLSIPLSDTIFLLK